MYPPTPRYCQGALIKYKAWSKDNPLLFRNEEDILNQFNCLLKHRYCPSYLKNEMKRLETSYNIRYMKTPTNTNIDPETCVDEYDSDDSNDCELNDVLAIPSSFCKQIDKSVCMFGHKYDSGLMFDWSKRLTKRDPFLQGHLWLKQQIGRHITSQKE